MTNEKLMAAINTYMPPRMATALTRLEPGILDTLEEIRLRAVKPLMIRAGGRQRIVDGRDMIIVSPTEVEEAFSRVCRQSVYALEDTIKETFITLPGGYRVGISGTLAMYEGNVKSIRCSGLVFRIAREIIGAAAGIIPFLYKSHRYLNTLILSPPGQGKTTLLRDLARIISSDNHLPANVLVVDERSELACCAGGVPQLNVGSRTDVLEGCPKAKGILLGIRTLAPDVIITDELGGEDDTWAVREAALSGITVMASAHAPGLEDAMDRQYLKPLLERNIFERAVILGTSRGVGTIEAVTDIKSGVVLYGSLKERDGTNVGLASDGSVVADSRWSVGRNGFRQKL